MMSRRQTNGRFDGFGILSAVFFIILALMVMLRYIGQDAKSAKPAPSAGDSPALVYLSKQVISQVERQHKSKKSQGGLSPEILSKEALDRSDSKLSASKPTKEDYERILKTQVEYCGELCTVDISKLPKPPVKTSVESLKKSYISRPVQCDKFFSKRAEELFDGEKLEWPPPREPPVKFTLHDERVWVTYFNDQQYSGKTALTAKWDTEELEKDIALLRERKFRGS